jgi:hypothetical protein
MWAGPAKRIFPWLKVHVSGFNLALIAFSNGCPKAERFFESGPPEGLTIGDTRSGIPIAFANPCCEIFFKIFDMAFGCR